MGLVLHACCVISFLGTIQGLIPADVPSLMPKIPDVPSLIPNIKDLMPEITTLVDMDGLENNPTKFPAELSSTNKKIILTPYRANITFSKGTQGCTNTCNEGGRMIIKDTPACQKTTEVRNAFTGNKTNLWDSCMMYCNGSVHTVDGKRGPYSVMCESYDARYKSIDEAKKSNDSKAVTISEFIGKVTSYDNKYGKPITDVVPQLIEDGSCKSMEAINATAHVITGLACNKGYAYKAKMESGNLATTVVCVDTGLNYSPEQLSKICELKNKDGVKAKYLEMPKGNKPNTEPKYFEQPNQDLSMVVGSVREVMQSLDVGIL